MPPNHHRCLCWICALDHWLVRPPHSTRRLCAGCLGTCYPSTQVSPGSNGASTRSADAMFTIKYTEPLVEAKIARFRWKRRGGLMTTPWLIRSTMACSKLRSSTDVVLGTALNPLNTLPSKGSTGSTTAALWNLSEIPRQQKPTQTSTQLWNDQTPPLNEHKSAFNKLGAVKYCRRLSPSRYSTMNPFFSLSRFRSAVHSVWLSKVR